MENAEIHGSMNCLDHVAALITSILVAILDRFRFPICPVDPILPYGDGEHVMQVHAWMHVSVNDHFAVASFQITDGNKVLPRIAPEKFVGFETDRQGVWPSKVVLDQHGLIRSIHTGFSDVRLITPICPVHISAEGIQHDSPWLLEVFRDQNFPIASVQFGDFYRVQTFVAPIQIPGNPIDRQAVRILQGRLVQSLRLVRAQAHPFD